MAKPRLGNDTREAMDRMSYRSTSSRFLRPLTLAHLALCAAAILRRAEADIVRFLGTTAMPFAFAQRAL